MTITFFSEVSVNGCSGCLLVWMNNERIDLYSASGHQLDQQYKVDDIMDIDMRQRKRHNELTLALKPATEESDHKQTEPTCINNNNPFDEEVAEEEDHSTVPFEQQNNDVDKAKSPIPKLSRANGLVVLRVRFRCRADCRKVLDFLVGVRIFVYEHYWVRRWTRLFVRQHKSHLVLPKWRLCELKQHLALLDGWKNTHNITN